MMQCEIAPAATNVMPVVGNTTLHFNMYLRLDVPQNVDDSSLHRAIRAAQLPTPVNITDAESLLGDTADVDYPIYRNGAWPDGGCVTLATGVFDLNAGTLTVFDSNPKSTAAWGTIPLH